MNPSYFFTPELIQQMEMPRHGMLSRALYDDNDVKIILFALAEGHEFAAHAAPMPASLYILAGEAELTLDVDKKPVKAGAFAHMPAHLSHAIRATTPLVMLLVTMKAWKRDKSAASD